MIYKVVLVKNKINNKTFLKTVNFEEAVNGFRTLIKTNKVDFPQKHMNFKGIIPIEYELLLVKHRKPNDVNRFVRDECGRVVEEVTTKGKWIIIDSAPYNVEETFYVYGYDSVNERFTIRDIIKKILLKGIKNKNMTKEVIVVRNKLIIQGDELDFVICKCSNDALRLYNKLKELVIKTKVENILFLGIATSTIANKLYHKIQEKTGWNWVRIWRSTTRP